LEAYYGRCNPVLLVKDNIATITVMERRKHIRKSTSYINVKYYLIHHWISSESIDLVYYPTGLMIAEVFTKSLPAGHFNDLMIKVMGI
jgi:hypothetical protein